MQLSPNTKELVCDGSAAYGTRKGRNTHSQHRRPLHLFVLNPPDRVAFGQGRKRLRETGKRRGNAFRPDHRALRRPTHKQPRAVMEKMFAFTGDLAFPNFYTP